MGKQGLQVLSNAWGRAESRMFPHPSGCGSVPLQRGGVVPVNGGSTAGYFLGI